MKLPVVLQEQRVVIILQVNVVRRRSQTASSRDGEEPGVEWSKGREVGHGRKKLKVLNLRFNPIYFCPQEIPAKLDVVLAQQLIDVGGSRRVLLVQRSARRVVAERE